MKLFFSILTGIVLLICSPVAAQTFEECADVSQDGNLNILDLVMMMNLMLGGPDLPAGTGDIDFRQNFNLGDVCYLSGYFFTGWPEGGCPPFASYTLLNPPDTLFLPETAVPPGSGSFILPISLSSSEPVSNLLVTTRMVATNCTAVIDSVSFKNWAPGARNETIMGDELTLIWGLFNLAEALPTGVHLIAAVHVSFTASTGGMISFVSDSFSQYRFTHHVYGPVASSNYSLLQIGVPQVVVSPVTSLPAISVAPDSLYFVILSGSGDPAAQTFDVNSDGAPVAWTSTAPAWLEVTPDFGITTTNVTVQPHTAGLPPGIHVGDIEISSQQAYNSPQFVRVTLQIQSQYPAFDANCDGVFNIADIIYLIQYIFGGPAPCDPCLGK